MFFPAGSFAQLNHWFGGQGSDGGVNVSIAWGTTAASATDANALADLRLTVGEAQCSNCSNYAIVLEPGFSPLWGRTGEVSVSGVGASQKEGEVPAMTIKPSGSLPPTTLRVSNGTQLCVEQHASLIAAMAAAAAAAAALGDDDTQNQTQKSAAGGSPLLTFAVESGIKNSVVVSSTVEPASATVSALRQAAAAEHALYASYGTVRTTQEIQSTSIKMSVLSRKPLEFT